MLRDHVTIANAFVLLFFTALNAGAASSPFSINLDHAKGHCVSFKFPQWDMRGWWEVGTASELEFRTTGETETAFLVALRTASYPFEGAGKMVEYYFSDQKYLISMERPGEAQSVPDAVWEEAEVVNHFRNPGTSENFAFARTLRDGEFDLANKTVKLRGKHWAGGYLSHVVFNRKKSMVALQSMNGRLLFDGEVYGGKAYVQVFNVKSGQELFWLEGNWEKDASSVVFSNTVWVRDDLLAVTFDPGKRRGTALCKVP